MRDDFKHIVAFASVAHLNFWQCWAYIGNIFIYNFKSPKGNIEMLRAYRCGEALNT